MHNRQSRPACGRLAFAFDDNLGVGIAFSGALIFKILRLRTHEGIEAWRSLATRRGDHALYGAVTHYNIEAAMAWCERTAQLHGERP